MSAQETAPRDAQPAGRARRRNGAVESHVEPAIAPPRVATRVVPRAEDGSGGTRARILVTLHNGAEIEITRSMVASIAHALWQARGEDHLSNWLDAESIVNDLLTARPAPAPNARPGRSAGPPARQVDDALPDLLPRSGRRRRL